MPDEQVEIAESTEPTAEDKTLTEFDTILEEKPEEKTEDVVEQPVEKALEIPEEQMEAGYAAGLTSEAITQLAETNPAVLKALAEFHSRAKEGVSEEEPEEAPEEEFKGLEHVSAPELDFKDTKVKELFAAIVGNQNKLIDQFNIVNKNVHDSKVASLRAQQATNQEFDAFVDNYFDTKVKENPEVGLSRALGRGQLQTRQSIFGIAKVLPKGTWQERLDTATKMWGVQKTEGDAERKIAAKLDGQKKKFSPRPGGQKSTKDVRSADEKGLDEFESVAEKYDHKWGE